MIRNSTCSDGMSIMKVIIKVLRVIVVLLSFSALIGYYILTSDVPTIVELNDLYIFISINLVTVIITIMDFAVCIRHNYRGGYLALCSEIIILILWILSYNGVNFQIIHNDVN